MSRNTILKRKIIIIPKPSFTGTLIDSSFGEYYQYLLDSSGVLTLGDDLVGKTMYVFCVGGGGKGGTGTSSVGGNGGNGGEIKGVKFLLNSPQTFNVKIGYDVSGADTIFQGSTINITAAGGPGGITGGASGQPLIGTRGGIGRATTPADGLPGITLDISDNDLSGNYTNVKFSTKRYSGGGGGGCTSSGNPGKGNNGSGNGGDGTVGFPATNYGCGGGGGGGGSVSVRDGGLSYRGAVFLFYAK